MKALFVAVLAVLLTAACLTGTGPEYEITLSGYSTAAGVVLEWDGVGGMGLFTIYASADPDPLVSGDVVFVSTKPWLHDNYFHEGSSEHYFIAKWMLDGCGAVARYSDVLLIP